MTTPNAQSLNSDAIVSDIIHREGGLVFTNRPTDRGGPTFAGITQTSWDDYVAKSPTTAPCRSVEALTEPAVRKFYHDVFVDPLAERLTDVELIALVADCGVCHGKTRAARWLQSAIGAAPDGVIGPGTAALANVQPGAYASVLRTRLAFLAHIATDQRDLPGGDPDAVNLPGWIARAGLFIR